MATIKFKHNQEWRNLEIPINILMGAGEGESDGTGTIESVKITGTDDRAKLPNLSAYISDLSQIAFMTWHDARTYVSGTTRISEIIFYAYCPSVSEYIFSFKDVLRAINNTATAPTVTSFLYDESKHYTLGGSVSSPIGVPVATTGTENKDLYFVSNIHLYYKGE